MLLLVFDGTNDFVPSFAPWKNTMQYLPVQEQLPLLIDSK